VKKLESGVIPLLALMQGGECAAPKRLDIFRTPISTQGGRGPPYNSAANLLPPKDCDKLASMNSRLAFLMIVVAALAALVLTVIGRQDRSYDQVMKEVGPTYANLKKNLDASAFPAAAEDASKLESLFKETERFWAPFKTKDALDFAKSAQAAAHAAGVAAKDNNGQKAQTAYNAIGKSCKGCHDSHREAMPDKSFRIKP
jgi:cytochrome c556